MIWQSRKLTDGEIHKSGVVFLDKKKPTNPITNGNLHVKQVVKEFFELVAEDWVNLQQKETMAVWFWQTHFNFIPGKSSVSLVFNRNSF